MVKNLNGTPVSPATTLALDAHLSASPASLLHLICHGESRADDAVIRLDDDEELRSTTLQVLPGFRKLCRRRAPFVFINA